MIDTETKQFVDEGELTCANCGHKGHDVHTHLSYFGGKGFLKSPPECDDIPACWARWDEMQRINSRRD